MLSAWSCRICGTPLGFRELLLLRRLCPACGLLHGPSTSGDLELADDSRWYYMRQLEFVNVQVGPIDENRFLSLVLERRLKPLTLVRSPEFTNNQWQNLQNVRLDKLRRRIEMRQAVLLAEEDERLQRLAQLRQELRQYTQQATHPVSLLEAARRIPISIELEDQDLRFVVESETQQWFDREMLEADADTSASNLLERLQNFLNCIESSVLDKDQRLQLELIRYGDYLSKTSLSDLPLAPVANRRGQREPAIQQVHACCQSIDPSGKASPLSYRSRTQHVRVTPTHLLVLDAGARLYKIAHSQITRVIRFANGVYFEWRRSRAERGAGATGTEDAGVFAEFAPSVRNHKFALLLCRVARIPLQARHLLRALRYNPGTDPHPLQCVDPASPSSRPWLIRETIVITDDDPPTPDAPAADSEDAGTSEPVDHWDDDFTLEEPSFDHFRYRFRVVGTRFENREQFVDQLSNGDPVFLMREPENPYDPNAVAVYDVDFHQLGYLRRSVARWYSRKIDRPHPDRGRVLEVQPGGSLVIEAGEIEVLAIRRG